MHESYIWNSRQIKNSWEISPYTAKNTNMVEMIQRSAARSVLNRFDRKDGETEMLSTLERKTLKSRQTIARLP